jgi:hypothetical protein
MTLRSFSSAAISLFAFSLSAQSFPERPVSTIATFHNSEEEYAAASDGNDFLIVGARGGVLLAHHVTAAGEVLDEGTSINPRSSQPTYDFRFLGVFWGGECYTIVWQIQTATANPPAPDPPEYRVQVARTDRDGHLIDGPRTVLVSRFPLVGAASSDTRIVLVGDRITILDLRGNLLETNLPMPTELNSNGSYTVAWNGKGFMVAWLAAPFQQPTTALNFAPLDADGKPTGMIQSIGAGNYPVIASDGNDYIVVVKDPTGIEQALHVSAAGVVLERHNISSPLGPQRSIVWSGTTYIVAAEGSDAVVRLERNGVSVDPAPISISSNGTGRRMVLASNGRQILLSWREGDRSFAKFLTNDAKPSSDAFAIGVTPTEQRSPQIAIGGGIFMVVWQEGLDTYASRLTLAGESLDGRGIKLSNTTGSAPRVVFDGMAASVPRVIFDGQRFVAGWWSGTAIVTAHLSPDGTVLESSPRELMTSCNGDFDMATDGTSVLVAGNDCVDVAAVRVHRNGSADAPVRVAGPYATTSGFQTSDSTRVAWNGQQYLVVWRELIQMPPTTLLAPPTFRGNLHAARLSASLAVLDPHPIDIAVSERDDAVAPVLASNGSDFLVAWTTNGVRARTVKSDGTPGEPFRVADGISSDLVWDGRRYALAFSANNDVLLAHIGNDEVAEIAASDDVENAGALAPAGNGALIAAYVREASEAPYIGVPRVFVKGVVPHLRTRAVR